jgi:hypothetical protein
MIKLLFITILPCFAFSQQKINKVKITSPGKVIFYGKDPKVDIQTTIEGSPEKTKVYLVGAESRDSAKFDILTYRFGTFETLKMTRVDIKMKLSYEILNARYIVTGKSVSPFLGISIDNKEIDFQAVELDRPKDSKFFFEIVFTLPTGAHKIELSGVAGNLIQKNNISGL